MPELSAEKLAVLREIAEAASDPSGRWEYHAGTMFGDVLVGLVDADDEPGFVFLTDNMDSEDVIGSHLAAFDPETVLALLDRIEEQEVELAEFREREAASVLEFDAVTRVEVIETGQRGYVKRSSEPGATLFLQDDFRTLKVVIDSDGDGDEPR